MKSVSQTQNLRARRYLHKLLQCLEVDETDSYKVNTSVVLFLGSRRNFWFLFQKSYRAGFGSGYVLSIYKCGTCYRFFNLKVGFGFSCRVIC